MQLQNTGEIDRQKYIGGSDIAGILGISPWQSPLDIYLNKTQGTPPLDPKKEKIFARGKRLEPYITDLLQDETGLQIICRNNRYKHPEYEYIAAEIDAETEQENIEIKTVSPFMAKHWGEAGTDEIPVYYTAQAMHGLLVTGRQTCIIGALIGCDDFRIYRITRDDDTISAILEKEKQFWQMVCQRTPPPVTTTQDVLRLFDTDSGGSIEANPGVIASINNLRELKDSKKQLENAIDTYEQQIKIYMQDKTAITINNSPVIIWKTQKSARFNQDEFKKIHPELYSQFKKTVRSRVFRIR